MKKILLLLFFAITATYAYSQEESHLEFKNIPMTGKVEEFTQKLVSQGCEVVSRGVDAVYLEGPFVSKNCTIGVLATPISKTVWKVAAILPEHSSWRTIELEYENLKELYTSKYGEPSDVVEYVTETYLEDKTWLALQLGKCTYHSDWYIDTGFIRIAITESECIIIHYEDSVGSILKNEETQSDI